MRVPRLAIVLLILAVLFAGCAKPAGSGSKPVPLKWTGSALEGVGFTFFERRFPLVTVHYTPPTGPDQAEQMGETAQEFLTYLAKEGRCCPPERTHVWLIPSNAAWPAGLSENPLIRSRAVAPQQIISRMIDGPPKPTGGRIQPGYGPLDAALTVAVTQGEASPAFTVDWLHQGIGRALATAWQGFPYEQFKGASSAAEERMSWLQTKDPKVDTTPFAAALAALVIDRWGYDWTFHYPRKPEELTPEAMLLWATGTSDRATALQRFDARTKFVNAAFQPDNNGVRSWSGTARTISPERMAPTLPVLPKGPGPMDNYSPHSYAIKARYEPEKGTVTGEVTLTWQNGEGIPVDTLYFNLWPNSEPYAVRGARMSIQSAAVDGKPAAFTAQGLDLAVPLGRAVAHGEQVAVKVSFTTRLPGTLGPLLGQSGVQRFALGLWYPSLAVLDDRGWNLPPRNADYTEHADHTVELDVPAGTAIAATGRKVGSTEANGRWIYRYAAPQVLNWGATGSQGLEEVALQAGTVRLRIIGQDEKWRNSVAAEATRAIAALEQRYGAAPYTEMAIVHGTEMNFAGLIGVVGAQDPEGFWRFDLNSLLAEQWFSTAVGCDGWGDPWVCVAARERVAPSVARSVAAAVSTNRARVRPPLPADLKVTSPMHEFQRLDDYTLLYNKGPQVLDDLEKIVGRATMDRLLKELATRYRGKTVTTADFTALAEQVTGRDLMQFFADHLVDPTKRGPYRPTLPLGKMTLP